MQGSLFGAPEPTVHAAKNKVSTGDLLALNAGDDNLRNKDLSDADLSDDALTRPRRRREADGVEADCVDETNGNSTTDEPAWAHHSQLQPEQLTPVLRHYVELKMAHPERVLLYRLGDFFECFFEDAITLSRELELTLTGKDAGKAIGRVPMAGIPHHAAERYCSDLIRLGYSVALCDQLETTPAKGALLKRDITRVLTPGTVLEEGMLSARRNNWLAAVVVEPANKQQPFRWGLAQADVSTGDVQVLQREGSDGLHQHLAQLQASELLWSGDDPAPAWCPDRISLTPMSSTPFSRPEAEAALLQHYNLASLDGLGLPELPLALQAIGGLLRYVRDTQPLDDNTRVPLDVPAIVHSGDALVLDAQTRRNLELTATQRDGLLQGSLLWAIDRTLTAMGGRCLRRWIEAPLMDRAAIEQRQAVVSSLVEQRALRQALRRLLRPMGDLERLAGRAGAGHAGARDLVAIADGLERLPQLAAQLKGQLTDGPEWLHALFNPHPQLQELATSVSNTLLETPPLSLSEGGLIHDGVDPLLDGLRNKLDDQDAWLAQQEQQERQLSGISTLKLQHHRTFGYFLAVSKAKAATVPNHWIRRQTLANEERFITPELKEREGRIFQLRARACQREYELFVQLREQVGAMATSIREAARAVAGLDALTGLSDVAAVSNFCAPELTNSRELTLSAARHPVVEQLLVETPFIPNDVALGNGTDLVVLTGPNASGKSCYLRQIGLI
jgi:DNA mismatch repair protein MutS